MHSDSTGDGISARHIKHIVVYTSHRDDAYNGNIILTSQQT